MKKIIAAQKAKPLIIHIKPFMQGLYELQPTYGITKVAILDGKLTYITEKDGEPFYIFDQWVVKEPT